MIHELAALIAGRNLIFGGYVRDLINNVPPNDLDVEVEDHYDAEALIAFLSRKGYRVDVDTMNMGYCMVRAVVSKDGKSVGLDLVPHNKKHYPDFDVNHATMESDCVIVRPDVLRQIASKHITHGCVGSLKRYEKMVAKGYTFSPRFKETMNKFHDLERIMPASDITEYDFVPKE